MKKSAIDGIEKIILYKFRNKELLICSLSHPSIRSVGNVQYQRLEFFGDKILSFIIAQELFKVFPNYTEAMLTKHHNFLVSEKTMASLVQKEQIDNFIILSPAEEKQGGRKKNSILADTLEALVGAVYLDSNMDNTIKVVKNIWKKILYDKYSYIFSNPKSTLQEILQKKLKKIPQYHITDKVGQEHKPKFYVKIQIEELYANGVGNSKKEAQESAARSFLQKYAHELEYQLKDSTILNIKN